MICIFLCSVDRIQRFNLLTELNNRFTKQRMSTHIIECNCLEDIFNHCDKYIYPSIIVTDNYFTDEEFNFIHDIKLLIPNSLFIHTGLWTVQSNKEIFSPDYLISHFSIDVLWNCIRKAYLLLIADKDHFAYYKRPEYISTHLSFIMYFCSEGRKINIVSNDNNIIDSFYSSLDDVETFLQNKDYNFIRIHKSYLVNEQYIATYNKDKLLLISGNTLNISNQYYYTSLHHLLSSKPIIPTHK